MVDLLNRFKSLLAGRSQASYDDVRRNDDCPCRSGKKFKLCCMERVERKARAVLDSKLFGSRKS